MNVSEAFRSAYDGISSHKMRSGLTMLGIMFGVGAVISILSIGAGAAREAQKMIDRMGLRNVLIQAKQLRPDELQAVRKRSLGLSLRDAEAIREAVAGVELVGPRLKIVPWKVLAGEAKTEATVYGVSHRHRDLVNVPLAEGRFLDALDEKEHAQVCVIGAGVRRDLFGYGPAVGNRMKVNDLWCEVVGVTADIAGAPGAGTSTGAGSPSHEIYLPVSTAARKLEQEPLAAPLDEIVVRLAAGVSSSETAGVIKALLDGLHGGIDDIEIVVPEALLAQSQQTQRLFNLVMGCIAGISLLVGGIGIMNIMLASVLERTREIGLRRAIGAHRWDIVFQFIVESFSISALGGLCGIAIGITIAQVVASYAHWPTVVTVTSIALALFVSMAVGILSGLYPAMRAARISPIQALRYD